jgi:23S rRNA (cytosine1962-C5)-methyltransferase
MAQKKKDESADPASNPSAENLSSDDTSSGNISSGTLPYEMFENRLRKMLRHNGRWARRQSIEAFRVYDRDVPQFPIIIDRYRDDLVVSILEKSDALHAKEDWQARSLEIIANVFEIDRSRIFVRIRQRVEGGTQGAGQSTTGAIKKSEVVEAGLRFEIHLSGHLDTGLFLDHRITRSLVRAEAAGKRFLNLFAYTGSFSVYAAAGGALTTTTADLSPVNLEWAERNMRLNGFTGREHRFVETDILRGLDDFEPRSFDLAVLDPPTFSKSRRMVRDFDVARDHPEMIERTLRLLVPGGVLYFSSNLKKFKIQADQIRGAEIKDITAQTVPPDFRMQRPHACYRIVKK